MSKKEEYAEQVRLLIRLLPIIDKEDCFALKGGTAINLFYRAFAKAFRRHRFVVSANGGSRRLS